MKVIWHRDVKANSHTDSKLVFWQPLTWHNDSQITAVWSELVQLTWQYIGTCSCRHVSLLANMLLWHPVGIAITVTAGWYSYHHGSKSAELPSLQTVGTVTSMADCWQRNRRRTVTLYGSITAGNYHSCRVVGIKRASWHSECQLAWWQPLDTGYNVFCTGVNCKVVVCEARDLRCEPPLAVPHCLLLVRGTPINWEGGLLTPLFYAIVAPFSISETLRQVITLLWKVICQN
jgi:hypothetical protein